MTSGGGRVEQVPMELAAMRLPCVRAMPAFRWAAHGSYYVVLQN